MTADERARLTGVRDRLLALHKALLEWERATYEREHGRATAGELLAALMNDQQFAWLHAISELIVRIDESLEIDALDGPEIDVAAIVTQARRLVTPDEHGDSYARRYHSALQDHPDAIIAHRAVRKALGE